MHTPTAGKSMMKESVSPQQDEIEGTDNSVALISPAQARRILWKTDLVVTPLAVLSMTLAFLDKNALGYAAIFGIKQDADLHGQDYSWLSSIFYFGYLAMEFPNMWLMTKVPVGKYVGGCLWLWGAAICVMSTCHNFAGLAAIRFFLGVFEAALLPCMLIVNSMWYRREEQPLRTALWYNTFAGIFGGILSYGIANINGPLSTWKYIFLIYGAFTILSGFLLFFGLPDHPSKAWFFTEDEKKLAVFRLADNQTGVNAHKKFDVRQIKEVFTDPRCYCILTCAFAYAIVNAGITNFNPLIISGYKFGPQKTVLMATPQAAVAMVSQAILTGISLWIPNLRCIFWIVSALIGLCGAILVHVLDATTQRGVSLAGVYIMGFYNVPWVFMLSLSSSNTAGATKKSFMGAAVAIVYAIGNIVGPQFFLTTQSPKFVLGIGAMMLAFAVMAASGTLYYFFCVIENRRRDSRYGKPHDNIQTGIQVDVDDSTDVQNTNFRYTF